MLYFNSYEIADARARYSAHPILGDATETLAALAEWTDSHSDGWAYWPKPARAAKRLMELIGSLRTYLDNPWREEVTRADLVAAYRAVRSFRTRFSADFPIYLDGRVS